MQLAFSLYFYVYPLQVCMLLMITVSLCSKTTRSKTEKKLRTTVTKEKKENFSFKPETQTKSVGFRPVSVILTNNCNSTTVLLVQSPQCCCVESLRGL